jgi:hypothetical protein
VADKFLQTGTGREAPKHRRPVLGTAQENRPGRDAFDRNDGLGVTGKDKHRCRALFGSERGGAKTSKDLLPKTLIKARITVGFLDTMVTTLSGTDRKNFYR